MFYIEHEIDKKLFFFKNTIEIYLKNKDPKLKVALDEVIRLAIRQSNGEVIPRGLLSGIELDTVNVAGHVTKYAKHYLRGLNMEEFNEDIYRELLKLLKYEN